MEVPPVPGRNSLRLSRAPSRSPVIVNESGTPTSQSHRATVIDSIHDTLDDQDRGLDKFSDTSGSDDHSSPTFSRRAAINEPGTSNPTSPRSPKTSTYLGSKPSHLVARCGKGSRDEKIGLQDFLRSTPRMPTAAETERRFSIPSSDGTTEEGVPERASQVNLQAMSGGRVVYHSSPNTSQLFTTSKSPATQIRAEQILAAHTSTLQALSSLHEEGSVARRVDPVAIGVSGHRSDRSQSAPPRPVKKVALIPPPIDVGGPQYQLPEDLVRTPYPFVRQRPVSDGSQFKPKRTPPIPTQSPYSATISLPPHDAVLTLRLRSRNNMTPRVSLLTIPAPLDFLPAIPASKRSKKECKSEKRFATSDFDDASMFEELCTKYRDLVGPLRLLFSARSLQRIAIVDTSNGGPARRSPRFLVSRGLSDTFSEERMWAHYRNPQLGKARFAWVHWAHRLACNQILSPPTPFYPHPAATPRAQAEIEVNTHVGVGQAAGVGGLEFVEGWCAWKIAAAVLCVLVVAVAAALLWLFLGTEGTRESRIGDGFLVGIFAVLLGWSGVGAWVGLSWFTS